MAKLSAREKAAKAAGVAVDYTKSASQQGKSTAKTSVSSTSSVSPRKKGESRREYEARSTGGTLDYKTGKITKPAPATPSKVGNLDDAKSFINSNQVTDSASVDPNTPDIRASTQRYQAIADGLGLGGKLEGLDSTAPAAPKFEDTYGTLRSESGIDALETKLNDLTAQEEALAEQARVNKGAQEGKAVAMGVIEGRVSEQERQTRDEMDYIARLKNSVTNELNTKYAVIDKIIQLKGMDYEVAKGKYDTQFSQALQTMNLVKGIDDTIKSDAERAQDNARANLQIIYNNIANNPDGYKSLDKNAQNMVAKLELQSGLPMGTFQSIAAKNPGGEIVTTKSWQDAGGKEYVSVVTKDPKTGALKTSNMYVGQGKVSGSGSGTTADERQSIQVQSVETLFDRLKGKDGYVNPSVWNDALRAWSGSASDFVARFKNYANTKDRNNNYNGIER